VNIDGVQDGDQVVTLVEASELEGVICRCLNFISSSLRHMHSYDGMELDDSDGNYLFPCKNLAY
jgi:hypothetical protein